MKEYCGFLCGEQTQKQQEIVDEIKELQKVNPEFASEFRQKLIGMLSTIDEEGE